MSRMSGKIALITGAASGLGKADALILAREGATVILTDINDEGQALAEKISDSTGQQARFFTRMSRMKTVGKKSWRQSWTNLAAWMSS